MEEQKYYDLFTLLIDNDIKCLDGFVKLIDMMPRLAPIGRTAEFAIVRNARVSYGDDSLKSKLVDDNLVRYMFRHKHTSPFESIVFTFLIRAPRFVTTQIVRHRTGAYNEVSQRYTEQDKNDYMHLSEFEKDDSRLPEGSIRLQSDINHQGSDNKIIPDDIKKQIDELVSQSELCFDQIYDVYNKLIELGIAKECARNLLPISSYSNIYMTMNLHNLLHFLELRMEQHAQAEIRVYANAIYKIVCPLVPIVMECFNERINSISLTTREIQFIQEYFIKDNKLKECIESYKGSKTEKHELMEKMEKIFQC